MLFMSCVFMLLRLFIGACGHVLCFCHFPMWYPGSGVVLDCIDY